MTEKRFTNEIGIDIIQTDLLPRLIPNKETGELETYHMIQKEDAIYVSEELFGALEERINDGDEE